MPSISIINTPKHTIPLNVRSMELTIARDNEIVSAVRAGSPVAFAEIHAIYSRRLYATIIAITKSPEDAEDALQETFLRAYLAIDTFENRSSVYTWLTRIAVNSALTMLRKRRACPEILFDPQPNALVQTICFEPADAAPNPEQECDLRQRLTKLSRAIRNLDKPLREPLRMRMAEGASLAAIGQALNISEGAVKARLRRARLRLSAMCHLKRCGSNGNNINTRYQYRVALATLNYEDGAKR